MRLYRSFLWAGVLTAMAMLVLALVGPAAATENDGQTVRAYFALPFGLNKSATQDYQIGLQLRQGVRDTISNPIATHYDFAVFDFSFTGNGKIGGDVMGVDLVQMFKLTEDGTKLGQNGTGLDNPALWVAGGVAGAAILCITKTICSDSDAGKKPLPCAQYVESRLGVACAPTFRERWN
jgi:hypothetical protein